MDFERNLKTYYFLFTSFSSLCAQTIKYYVETCLIGLGTVNSQTVAWFTKIKSNLSLANTKTRKTPISLTKTIFPTKSYVLLAGLNFLAVSPSILPT